MADVRPIDANALNLYDIPCHYGCTCDLEDVEEWVFNAPTLDYALVVHAEWVWDDDGFCRCSHCKQKAPVVPQYNDEPITTQTDYCPHCGAKMEVQEDAQ